MDHTNIPDPVLDRFEALEREIIELRKKLDSKN
jgi:serine O-acetyltransferase